MHAFFWLLIFVASLWVVELADALANLDLDQYGIIPRDMTGLRGIPLHIFLHGDFSHLLSNTPPLIILGGLISLRGKSRLFWGTVFITLVGGSMVWLVAGLVTGDGIHIGASGVVFGYFGYLSARAFHERSFSSIFIALVVIVFYGGGILIGLLPTDPRVSLEGHLFGLLAGVTYAGIVGRQDRDARESEQGD